MGWSTILNWKEAGSEFRDWELCLKKFRCTEHLPFEEDVKVSRIFKAKTIGNLRNIPIFVFEQVGSFAGYALEDVLRSCFSGKLFNRMVVQFSTPWQGS
jgi:hypothetical protein